MKKGYFLYTIVLLWGIAGCSKESFFGESASAEPDAKVITISDGTLLPSSGEIPLSLSVNTDPKKKELSEPYSLVASIQTLDGTEVATVTIPKVEPQNGPLPSLLPPSLPKGTYVLIVTLQKGQTQAFQKRVTFFVDPGSYTLQRISFYPPSVPPLSVAILRVEAQAPQGADPWIRWSIQGKVVQEKLLSNGGAEFRWVSPEKEGVYPVRVDLYPVPPKEGSSYSFPSSLHLTTQLVVSSKTQVLDADLQPEKEHYALFHFMGNLKDSGTRKNKVEYGKGHVKELGSPEVTLKGTVFGYYLDGKSGFQAEQLLLPGEIDPEGNRWKIRFRLRPEGPVEDRTWLEMKDKEGNFHLRTRVTETQTLEALVRFGTVSVTVTSAGTIKKETAQLVELLLETWGNILIAQWMVDGTVAGAEQKVELPDGWSGGLSKGGTTWIGKGEEGNGFLGILDEFGVHVQGKKEPKTTEWMAPAPMTIKGKVEETATGLTLSEDSSVRWEGLPLPPSPVEVSLRVEKVRDARMEVLVGAAGGLTSWVAFFWRDGQWLLSAEGKEYPVSAPTEDTVRFAIEKQKEKVNITWNEITFSLTGEEKMETFSLQVENLPGSSKILRILGIKFSDLKPPLENQRASYTSKN